jgi:hypothetical protein
MPVVKPILYVSLFFLAGTLIHPGAAVMLFLGAGMFVVWFGRNGAKAHRKQEEKHGRRKGKK